MTKGDVVKTLIEGKTVIKRYDQQVYSELLAKGSIYQVVNPLPNGFCTDLHNLWLSLEFFLFGHEQELIERWYLRNSKERDEIYRKIVKFYLDYPGSI